MTRLLPRLLAIAVPSFRLRATVLAVFLLPSAPAPVVPAQETPNRVPVTAVESIETAPGFTLHYVANEGYLLEGPESSVLIDALHVSGGFYERVADETLEAMMEGHPPFDDVHVVLVSHDHADHFDAATVARYLGRRPGARLWSSRQVAERVRVAAADLPETMRPAPSRIVGVSLEPGERRSRSFGDVQVTLFPLRHGPGRFAAIENLGHVITIGGRRVLHVGDADPLYADFRSLDLKSYDLDVALLPFWYLRDASLRPEVETIVARTLVATHVPPSMRADIGRALRREHPEVVWMMDPGERRRF